MTSRTLKLLTRSHAAGRRAGPGVELEVDPWADTAGLDAFDVVLFSEVIEHFNADPSHCLHGINRVLRDGGQRLWRRGRAPSGARWLHGGGAKLDVADLLRDGAPGAPWPGSTAGPPRPRRS